MADNNDDPIIEPGEDALDEETTSMDLITEHAGLVSELQELNDAVDALDAKAQAARGVIESAKSFRVPSIDLAALREKVRAVTARVNAIAARFDE